MRLSRVGNYTLETVMFKLRHNLAKAGGWVATLGVTAAVGFAGVSYESTPVHLVEESGTVSFSSNSISSGSVSKISNAKNSGAKQATVSTSPTASAGPRIGALNLPSESSRRGVCQALNEYPKASNDSLSFRSNVISGICQPFVKYKRADLDRCGDTKSDPYLSKFTWPSRLEMSKRGKANVYTDAAYQGQLAQLLSRAGELRDQATNLCCGPDDVKCRESMEAVQFNVCKPVDDPNQPDPCVFGGTYRMPGSGYDSIFRAISRQRGSGVASDLRAIANRNLSASRRPASDEAGIVSGAITLTSYISTETGSQSMEPVILHELGHACSMIKMENASIDGRTPDAMKKAFRAAQWLDSAKKRCDPDFKIPEAVDDFWESIGETRELSSCLKDLATLNQKKLIDKPCNGLCPGHYLEESVGIAFSLLLGDLSGGPSAVFPNTCDHVRDGQHPMVSDVAECLLQNSPRFRSRMGQAYGCESRAALPPPVATAPVAKSSL